MFRMEVVALASLVTTAFVRVFLKGAPAAREWLAFFRELRDFRAGR